MRPHSAPLAWRLTEAARHEIDDRYNDNFKAVFRRLRLYSAKSVVDAALRRLSAPYPSVVEELQSFPWLTLLLVKWALRDGNVNLWAGRRISDQEFEQLLQMTWDLHDSGYGARPVSNVFLMLRGLLPAQLEFQRPGTWGFLRWPALLARQQAGHRARRLFSDEFGVQPEVFMDLCLALHGLLLDRPPSVGPEWLHALRPAYGPAIERLLGAVSRSLLELRAELQSDLALRNRGRHELVEFPYLKRFPLVRMRDGSLRCWHPTVFSRGMEEIVHLRLGRHGAHYTEPFSRLFEQHVVGLLADAACRMVTEDRYWGTFGRHAAAVEAILPFDGCNVLVEAKLSLFGDEVLHTDSETEVHAKTKVLREAVRKAAKVVDALAEMREALVDCPPAAENFLLVVTSRELYVSGGEQLERLYPEGRHVHDASEAGQRLPLAHVFFVAIDEFEKLAGCVRAGTVHLPELLREASGLNRDPKTAKPFLSDYLRRHVVRWPVPRLITDARTGCEGRLTAALEGPAA